MREKKKITWSTAQIKSQAALKLKGNYAPINRVIFLSAVALFIIEALTGYISDIVFRNFFLSLLFTSVISVLINGSFVMGIHNSALNVAKNIKSDGSDMIIGFKRIGSAISLQVVYEIISFGFSIMMGILTYLFYGYATSIISLNMIYISVTNIIFFIIAILLAVAFIGAMAKLAMTWFVMIENPHTDLGEIVNISLNVMKGNEWKFIGLMLSFLGWILLAALVIAALILFFGLFISVTVILIAAGLLLLPLYSYIYASIAQFYLCATGREYEYLKEDSF